MPYRLTGVFEVVEAIEEIGARRGDRIVVRPWALRVAVLQRVISPHFAFDERCRIIFTRPDLSHRHALQILRDRLPRPPRPHHLRLME